MRILILGGYGTFGGRLAHLIAGLPVQVLIAGRSLAKARAFCADLPPQFQPLHLDRADIATALATHQPDLLVDASGPFQRADYTVPRACIAHGVHYLDLADASDFVCGIDQLDPQAQAAQVTVLSGLSTFPALSGAVVQEIAKRMRIETLTIGIAPSPHAGMGLNVMRAVLSYAGAPLQHGLTKITGLCSTRRATIGPPGHVPLRPRRFALVDVPDLRLMPMHLPTLRDIWIGAGPLPTPLLRCLVGLARLRSWGIVPPLAPLAPLAHRVLNALRFGEDRGGFYVTATGEGRRMSWHLLAEGADGPRIPSMAAEIIIRHALAGRMPAPGARTALGAMTLQDFQDIFAKRSIRTGWQNDQAAALYPRVLGAAYDQLPPQVQAIHAATTSQTWAGEAQVTQGATALGRLIGRIFGFPTRDATVPVTVRFDRSQPDPTKPCQETWTRDFNGRILVSHQTANGVMIDERFGPVTVTLAVQVRDGALHLIPRSWRLFGVPMPRVFLPSGPTYETETQGRFRFHVDIRLPLLGRMVLYRGWLTPVSDPARVPKTAQGDPDAPRHRSPDHH